MQMAVTGVKILTGYNVCDATMHKYVRTVMVGLPACCNLIGRRLNEYIKNAIITMLLPNINSLRCQAMPDTCYVSISSCAGP